MEQPREPAGQDRVDLHGRERPGPLRERQGQSPAAGPDLHDPVLGRCIEAGEDRFDRAPIAEEMLAVARPHARTVMSGGGSVRGMLESSPFEESR